MYANSSCPCCSGSMLLHLNSRRSYWFCTHCRLEMPNLDSKGKNRQKSLIQFHSSTIKAAIAAQKSKKPVPAM